MPFGHEKMRGYSSLQGFNALQYEYLLVTLHIKPPGQKTPYKPTHLHVSTGARFGPRAIRAASARQTSFRGFNPRAAINPYQNWAKIIDCGDIPVAPMDNAVALRQMSEAFQELGSRMPVSPLLERPKLITLGGDSTLR